MRTIAGALRRGEQCAESHLCGCSALTNKGMMPAATAASKGGSSPAHHGPCSAINERGCYDTKERLELAEDRWLRLGRELRQDGVKETA